MTATRLEASRYCSILHLLEGQVPQEFLASRTALDVQCVCVGETIILDGFHRYGKREMLDMGFESGRKPITKLKY